MPKYRVEQERTVFTHSVLFEGAQAALKEGLRSGVFYEFMHALISSAFALEAYLNFAGESKIAFWRSIDRISTENKLELLCQQAGIVPDFGKRPYQSVKELWGVRNFLAHARVQSAKEQWLQEDPVVAEREYPLVDLEKKCCSGPAKRMVEDVEAVIRELHGKLGLSEGALGFLGHGGGRISRCEDA